MDAHERARSDMAQGRVWKARDRLNGLLGHRPTPGVADELARVHLTMQDLPAAGALWFAIGREGATATRAIAAWREQHGDAAAQWRSIPSPLRHALRSSPHMMALHEDAQRAERATIDRFQRKEAHRPNPAISLGDRVADVAVPAVALVVLLGLAAIFAVGAWTVWGWATH